MRIRERTEETLAQVMQDGNGGVDKWEGFESPKSSCICSPQKPLGVETPIPLIVSILLCAVFWGQVTELRLVSLG